MPDRYIVYCEAAMREQCAREGHVLVITSATNYREDTPPEGVYPCQRCGKYVEVKYHE